MAVLKAPRQRMKLPRDLSGQDLVNALCRNWGYPEKSKHLALSRGERVVPLPAPSPAGAGRVRGYLRASELKPHSRIFLTNSSGSSITSPFGNRSTRTPMLFRYTSLARSFSPGSVEHARSRRIRLPDELQNSRNRRHSFRWEPVDET